MGKYASILGLVDHESPSSAPGMAAQPAAAEISSRFVRSCFRLL